MCKPVCRNRRNPGSQIGWLCQRWSVQYPGLNFAVLKFKHVIKRKNK